MIDRLSKRREDEGFTLIELLVVIIIIGILAAIAIPVFLNQRRNAWDAAVQADLRNAATAQETYLTAQGVYTDDVADLQTNGFKFSGAENYSNGAAFDVIEGVNADASAQQDPPTGDGYCMEATSASGTTFSYSSPGGLGNAACP